LSRAGVEGSIVVGKVLETKGNFGFDAQNEEYGDMVDKGIIDPTKVVRVALQDAASVASLLITTEAMIAEKPKDKAPAMPGGGGMGGMELLVKTRPKSTWIRTSRKCRPSLSSASAGHHASSSWPEPSSS
jgi:hypothetical protein